MWQIRVWQNRVAGPTSHVAVSNLLQLASPPPAADRFYLPHVVGPRATPKKGFLPHQRGYILPLKMFPTLSPKVVPGFSQPPYQAQNIVKPSSKASHHPFPQPVPSCPKGFPTIPSPQPFPNTLTIFPNYA